MKYITELNETEILELTQEDLDKMVKFKMAQEGLKFYIRPEEPSYHNLPEADIEVFKVGGVGYEFLTQESANAVAKVLKDNLNKMVDYSYPNGVIDYLNDYERNNVGNINSLKRYSKELWNKISELKKENDVNKANYESLLKQYNEAYEAAEYIRDEVYGKYRAISDKYANFKLALSNFLSYLELAGNDFEQAMKFYEKAYTPDVETIAYIKSAHNAGTPEAV